MRGMVSTLHALFRDAGRSPKPRKSLIPPRLARRPGGDIRPSRLSRATPLPDARKSAIACSVRYKLESATLDAMLTFIMLLRSNAMCSAARRLPATQQNKSASEPPFYTIRYTWHSPHSHDHIKHTHVMCCSSCRGSAFENRANTVILCQRLDMTQCGMEGCSRAPGLVGLLSLRSSACAECRGTFCHWHREDPLAHWCPFKNADSADVRRYRINLEDVSVLHLGLTQRC